MIANFFLILHRLRRYNLPPFSTYLFYKSLIRLLCVENNMKINLTIVLEFDVKLSVAFPFAGNIF